MDAMDQAQLLRLRSVLERRRTDLLRQMADDAALLGNATGQQVETSPADSASARVLLQLASGAASQHAQQLRDIQHALAKFATASYGQCEHCGEAIAISRLQATPEARLCFACQSRTEKARR
jgi:DnaK suppressor protein